MKQIHLTTALITLKTPGFHSLKCWTSKGEVREYGQCVLLTHDRKSGSLNIKLYPSGQIRKVSEVLIFELDEMEVYL